MTIRIRFVLLLFIVGSVILPFGIAKAQDPIPSDDEVNAIARKLYCPVCENTPLDVCPTTACHQWRELIRQMIAEGKSETEIEDYFVANYGARVLSEPPHSGINWLVYLVPPIAFVIGIGLLIKAFRIWRRSSKTSKDQNEDIPLDSKKVETVNQLGVEKDAEYLSRLENQLRDRI